MNKLFVCVYVFLVFIFSPYANSEDDLLMMVIPTLAAVLNCDAGEFESCQYRAGCIRINGQWQEGLCSVKSDSRLNTELMDGRWYLMTSFASGDFFNYMEFRKSAIKPISNSSDYFISGESHSTEIFDDPNANDVNVSYDSANNDWFMLDYWGRDIGVISAIEIERINDNRFTGCEFYLNYPDLTYQDGICNPVRMSRNGIFNFSTKNNKLTERQSVSSNDNLMPVKVPGTLFRSHATQIIQ